MDINALLKDRKNTHGEFKIVATFSQDLKCVLRASENYDYLSYTQKEALDNICQKIARILCGDPDNQDHWLDIQGYARLAMFRDEVRPTS